jgi:hypothetical protein
VSYANFLIHGVGVKTVIIGQLLPRDPRKSPVGYNAEVMRINNHIAQLAATYNDVHFWRHRGFWDSLSYLGRDGVHLTKVTLNGISPRTYDEIPREHQICGAQ